MRSSVSRSLGLALAAALLLPHPGIAAEELPPTAPAFGAYELVPLLDDAEPYRGPATPTSLDEVRQSALVRGQLPAAARERLAEQGFVVVPARLRLFHDAYRDQYGSGTPVYVTTDAAYHSWHLVFDKLLRDLEQERLLPALERLVRGMRQNAARQARDLAGTQLADDAAAVQDLLAATARILGVPSGELTARAKAERRLIEQHEAWTESPVTGMKTDYSLFTPRGHYTRNEDLTRYFVAMSVLGQHAFYLPGARLPDGSIADETGLRLGVLAARTLVGDPELEALWRLVFEPSAFLVGVADDYTPFELEAAVASTVPGGWADPLALAADEAVRAVGRSLADARPVLIDEERPSVRLMGTRFVLDSWILDQLVSPNVGTPDDPRVLGSALDLAAAFGSDYALAIQDAAGQTAKANYPEQMAAMREAVAARPDADWGGTVYDAWLAALEPMWLPRGGAFPDYMQRDGWQAKAHQTGSGSYAELRHDTILYTKQAGGDVGGGPLPRPVRSWVEPDPVPFERLSALAGLVRHGLAERKLLPTEERELLDGYIELVDRLARIAQEELSGMPLSEEDNDWLRGIGWTLERVWSATADRSGRGASLLDEDAAVIADVMRGLDPTTGKDEVLELGTGYVDRLFVVVPDDAGRFHVATGGVYSFYEFPWPTDDRLTDERWREMLTSGNAPTRPAWQSGLFSSTSAPEAPLPEPTPVPSRRALERELGSAIRGASWEPYRRSPRGAAYDPFESGAVAAVIFDALGRELHRSLDYAALFRFGSPGEMDGYWTWRTWDTESRAPMRTLACADGEPGRDTWQHGEYLCYVSDDGYGLLRWTDERTGTYGVLNAAAGRKDLARLYRSWAAITGEGDTEPAR